MYHVWSNWIGNPYRAQTFVFTFYRKVFNKKYFIFVNITAVSTVTSSYWWNSLLCHKLQNERAFGMRRVKTHWVPKYYLYLSGEQFWNTACLVVQICFQNILFCTILILLLCLATVKTYQWTMSPRNWLSSRLKSVSNFLNHSD